MPGQLPPNSLSPRTEGDIYVDNAPVVQTRTSCSMEKGCGFQQPLWPSHDPHEIPPVNNRTLWIFGRRKATLALGQRLFWPIGKDPRGRIRGPKAKKKAAHFIWHCVKTFMPPLEVC